MREIKFRAWVRRLDKQKLISLACKIANGKRRLTMNNETKRDVFEEMKWELISNLANTIYQNGGLRPLEDATKVGRNYATRYAAALPDDLPVIPKVVGEWIKDAKARYYDLLDAMTKWTLDQPVFDWIHDNSDTFARAWLDGVWRIEETGEIVKLEAE